MISSTTTSEPPSACDSSRAMAVMSVGSKGRPFVGMRGNPVDESKAETCSARSWIACSRSRQARCQRLAMRRPNQPALAAGGFWKESRNRWIRSARYTSGSRKDFAVSFDAVEAFDLLVRALASLQRFSLLSKAHRLSPNWLKASAVLRLPCRTSCRSAARAS